MDPLTIGLLVGAGLGIVKGMGNDKKEQEQSKYRQAAIKYSPWTGMGDPGSLNKPGPMESGLQGAVTGGSIGGMLKGAPGADGQGMGMMDTSGSSTGGSALGGQQMAGQLGNPEYSNGSPGAYGAAPMQRKYSLMDPNMQYSAYSPR